MSTNDIDMDALRSWIGRTETQWDQVTVPAVQRLAALLDRDDPLPRRGDRLPDGWHAILFPRVARQSQLGKDGHPRRGDFLPPVPLARRMFAGRRTTFQAPLRVGDEVRKDSTIAEVNFKEGRSGPMVFVTVSSGIHTDSGVAVTEEQDIVYRSEETVPRDAPRVLAPTSAAGAAAAAPSARAAAPLSGPLPWSRSIVADEVMLFRYSALTYNGHRIHYDLPYASGVEGYPALVVNGGLVALMLYELLRSHADAAVRHMSSRNMRPLFAGRPIRLEGEPVQGGARLQVLDASSAVAISAQVEWAN